MGKIAEKITLRSQRGYIGNRRVLFPRVRSVTQRIMEAFEHGRNGYLHNYAASYLNQLSTGTTPVTAVTDPAGFVADTRLGMALGSELVDTINTIAAWTASGTNTVEQDGDAVKITFVDNAAGAVALFSAAAGLSSNLTVGANYKITYEIKVNSGSVNAAVVNASTNQGVAVTSTSYITQSFIFNASHATTNNFTFANLSAGEIVWIKNISVRLFEGNHAIQATAGNRPTWTNRVNLLTYSGLMSNAAWTKRGTAAIVDGQADPYGGTTGELVTVGVAATNDVYQQIFGLAASAPLSTGVWIKRISTSGTLRVNNANGGASGQWEVNMALLPDEYIYLTASHAAVTVLFAFATTAGGGAGIQFGNNVAGDLQFLYGGTQQNLGSELSRYQRVTTATNFDTAGFPYYLSFPGASVSLTSATSGGGTAGVFWCGVVQFTGGAGTLQTIFADNGANTGYKVQKDVNNKLSFSAGNGAAFTTLASTAALSVGTKYLLTVRDNGTNLSVQIGSAAAETVARPVVTAGTAGFTIGKDNGAASSYLIANKYPAVYWKDTGGTDAEVADAQAYARMMGGL